ncbi:MAG: SAF domain-containing protein, partial [Chloroflexota bacterium]|nr:SAF domain-containing protein [Chloroflexota bacterium]
MNLSRLLHARAEAGRPVRVGLIGAGKFGTMFLAQVRHTPGMHLVGVADLSRERALAALARAGWVPERVGAGSLDEAYARGTTCVVEDALALIAADGVEVVVEATGAPDAGVRHALACFRFGKHAVLVNVEADALAGPLLARRAREAGLVYSLAYGDQPALICELVDWARACGFEVVCAGKGTKYLPSYHQSTPETVWEHFGFTTEEMARGDLNAKMFNSFVDGTKSAIEMAAVANATGLLPPREGLKFPPAGADALAEVLRPRSVGGVLEQSGSVEVVSSLERDGSQVARDLRWGVYVVFRAGGEYVADCFRQYGMVTDATGAYTALYRPYHLIGLEVGISVASAALRQEPTGAPMGFVADVVATAKRDLTPGEVLDGEGGYLVYGKLIPAGDSLGAHALPIGLAQGVGVSRPIAAGQVLTWADVEAGEERDAARVRREMEALF